MVREVYEARSSFRQNVHPWQYYIGIGGKSLFIQEQQTVFSQSPLGVHKGRELLHYRKVS